MVWLVLLVLLVKWVKPAHLVSPEVQEAKVIWVVLDRKEVKDCKVLVEKLVNLEFQENPALLAR